MKGQEYNCPIHGKYVQTGESKECPWCEYYMYVNFPENYEWEEDTDES